MKKLLPLLLTICMLAGICSASAQDTRLFTDSTGRQVAVPGNITRVAVTGAIAQYTVFALAPDLMAGIALPWDYSADIYLPEDYLDLPLLGQLYGGSSQLNPESLLAAAPDLVIDIGEPKANLAEELDELTALTGIPFLHFDASLATFGDTFLQLGSLLGREEDAARLAEYCRSAYALAQSAAARPDKTRLLYVTGPEGLNVIARNSYQSEIIDLLSDNLAVVESPSAKGTGNEVDMERILAWDPDFVIFSSESIYSDVKNRELWQYVTAVANGNYAEAPCGPQNWMGFPPGCHRCLGLLWMIDLLYPDSVDFDLYEWAAEYYRLFYHRELTREDFDALTKNRPAR